MITRNCYGKLEPCLGRYFVKKECGKYKILERYPYYITTAVTEYWDTPEFDSLVKAYSWLKANVNILL